MKIKLIRNATMVVSMFEKKILVDPMLGGKGSFGKFPWLDDFRENPLIDLPFTDSELSTLISQIDAVILTHLHPDHWDDKAREIIPKKLPIYCQPEDAASLENFGFKNVIPVKKSTVFSGIEIYRTDGKHGVADVGQLMGTVSGFVLKHGHETLYMAGDTIWCDEVIYALDEFSPTFIVVNGGGAKFNIGEHVTMNCLDIEKLLEHYHNPKIAVVHLEAVSPMTESRAYNLNFFLEKGYFNEVKILSDGEEILI